MKITVPGGAGLDPEPGQYFPADEKPHAEHVAAPNEGDLIAERAARVGRVLLEEQLRDEGDLQRLRSPERDLGSPRGFPRMSELLARGAVVAVLVVREADHPVRQPPAEIERHAVPGAAQRDGHDGI